MSYSKHKGVDTVCDHLQNDSEDQVQSAIDERENQFNEDSLHIVDAHLQSNNQESTPSVFKEKRALRSRNHCRNQSPSGPDKKLEGAGAKQPEESFFAWGCEMFKEILEKVNQILKNWTHLVQELTDLSKSVESILKVIKSFSSVAQSS